VQHLKVFGSITYVHVPKAARSKLDDKTIFIGYKHGGYKLYNPMTKKVIVSRDVTFAEMSHPNLQTTPSDHTYDLCNCIQIPSMIVWYFI